MNKNKQFIVVGLGRFGQAVVETLANNGYDVVGIDKMPEAAKRMEYIATDVEVVDVMDEDALRHLGFNNYDVAIIAIGESLEASIMATMYAKESGVPIVVAKAKTTSQKRLLEKVGADKVVTPEKDSGVRVATTLTTTNVLDYIFVSDKFGIAEINSRPEWDGMTLQSANIRAVYKFNVMAIKRGEDVIVAPAPNETLHESDTLVVMGENTNIEKFK